MFTLLGGKAMRINPKQKVILFLAIILVLTQCVFVPQNIKKTSYSAQGVPHTAMIRRVYKPIWYIHVEPWYDYEAMQEVKNPGAYHNYIDWERLLIQLFASVVILGCSFLIAQKDPDTRK